MPVGLPFRFFPIRAQFAQNCGFTQDQILGPEFKELSQAKKLIRTKSEDIISKSIQTPKTWYYPPFESSPLIKQDEEAANKYFPKL